jgi:hypothetical protein
MARDPAETTIWTRKFFQFVAIGLVVVAALVAVVLWTTKGAHLRLEGNVQKVRIQETGEDSAIAVVDFRFRNPSDVSFVVQEVSIFLVDGNGKEIEGMRAAEVDVQRIFQYYPLLGEKFNPVLRPRDQIAPHESMDRMVMASFPVSEAVVQQRKNLILRIEDVDGVVTEIAERED